MKQVFLDTSKIVSFLSGQQVLTPKVISRTFQKFFPHTFSFDPNWLCGGKFVEINLSPESYNEANSDLKALHKKRGFVFAVYLQYDFKDGVVVDRDRKYFLFYEPFARTACILRKGSVRFKRIVPFGDFKSALKPLQFVYPLYKTEDFKGNFHVVYSRVYALRGNNLRAVKDEVEVSDSTTQSVASERFDFEPMHFVYSGYSSAEFWKNK